MNDEKVPSFDLYVPLSCFTELMVDKIGIPGVKPGSPEGQEMP
ncbi:MAG: hypothetical protein ACPG39_05475 [Flavobacteriaceae bacterium]